MESNEWKVHSIHLWAWIKPFITQGTYILNPQGHVLEHWSHPVSQSQIFCFYPHLTFQIEWYEFGILWYVAQERIKIRDPVQSEYTFLVAETL